MLTGLVTPQEELSLHLFGTASSLSYIKGSSSLGDIENAPSVEDATDDNVKTWFDAALSASPSAT